MRVAQPLHLREIPGAHRQRIPAAGMERASGREMHRIGDDARDGLEFRAPVLDVRQGVEQALGIGMPQVVEYVLKGAALHDAPGVHDAHRVADLGHDAQVRG